MQPPLFPGGGGGGGAYWSGSLPWLTVIKACGRFKMSISETRRARRLDSLNPLALTLDVPLPKKRLMPKKTFWGDQEPLSKVRTAPGGRGRWLFPRVERTGRPRGPTREPLGFARTPE